MTVVRTLRVHRVRALVLAAVVAVAVAAVVPAAAQADNPGVVSYDADPVVGTALTATLSDDDTVSGTTGWQWARSTRPGDGFTNISGATTVSYTPADDDHAFFLRATATYTDSNGAGMTAEAATALPVGVSASNLVKNTAKATTQRGSFVAVSQRFTTGDSPAGYLVTSVQLFSGKNDNSEPLEIWTRRSGESGFGSRAYRLDQVAIEGNGHRTFEAPPGMVLEAGKQYWLRHGGASGVFSTAATLGVDDSSFSGWLIDRNLETVPDEGLFQIDVAALRMVITGLELLGPPGPPGGVTATASGGEVVLSWSEPASTGHRDIEKYQVRYKKTTDAGFGAWADVGDSADAGGAPDDELSVKVAGLDAGAQYTLAVRAVNERGEGTAAEATGTPTARTNAAPVFASDGVERTVLENTASGNVGAVITATDADSGDTLTYWVTAADGSDGPGDLVRFVSGFEVDASSGQVSVKAGGSIDYESGSSFKVAYQVSDGKKRRGAPPRRPPPPTTLWC